MKKTYIVPEVTKVIYGDAIMEGEIKPQSVGLKGSVSGQTDTNWQFGEDGQTGHDPDAKRNGRFWDDEY